MAVNCKSKWCLMVVIQIPIVPTTWELLSTAANARTAALDGDATPVAAADPDLWRDLASATRSLYLAFMVDLHPTLHPDLLVDPSPSLPRCPDLPKSGSRSRSQEPPEEKSSCNPRIPPSFLKRKGWCPARIMNH